MSNKMLFLSSFSEDDIKIKNILKKELLEEGIILLNPVEDFFSNINIIEHIKQLINDSDNIIIENSNANPNIFFEAGYALGRNKKVIFLMDNSSKIPMDLANYMIIRYDKKKVLKENSFGFKKYRKYFENITEKELKNSVESINLLGKFYINNGKYKEAIKYYNNILEISKDDEETYKTKLLANMNLGIVSTILNRNKEAELYYKKALNLSNQLTDTYSEAKIYNNLGNIYSKYEKFQKAHNNYKKALQIMQSLDKKYFNTEIDITNILNNISICNIKQNKFNEAINIFNEIILIYNQIDDDKIKNSMNPKLLNIVKTNLEKLKNNKQDIYKQEMITLNS